MDQQLESFGFTSDLDRSESSFPSASSSIFAAVDIIVHWHGGGGNSLRERGRGYMGGERKRILVGLAVAIFLGLAVYLRLWTIDYAMSSADAELLRRQFDLANREAMDESAEWRRLFDKELDRAKKCKSELNEIKESLEKKADDATRIYQNLTKLQEENVALREQVDAIKRKLEAEKLRCASG